MSPFTVGILLCAFGMLHANNEPPSADGVCPAENGEFVSFLRDLADCSVFYFCDHGNAVQMSCLDGLHFNPELHVCDWPQNVGCVPQVALRGSKVVSSDSEEPALPDSEPPEPEVLPDSETVHDATPEP